MKLRNIGNDYKIRHQTKMMNDGYKYKHINNMQNLLQQYDRENRFLNEQVLQLLRQNSRLKQRKLNSSIFSELSSDTSNRPKRLNSKSVLKTQTVTRDISPSKHITDQQPNDKSSDAVVNLIVKNQNENQLKQRLVQNNQHQSTKQSIKVIDIPTEFIADESFSFRKTPVKNIQEINSDTKNISAFSVIQKVTQQKNNYGQANSSFTLKQQISIEKLNKSCSQSSSFSRLKTVSIEKAGRHQLKPSPKINDKSIPKDRINMSPLISKKSNNQRQKIMNRILESGQKKRRFIEVVSNRFTPPKIIRQNTKNPCDCC